MSERLIREIELELLNMLLSRRSTLYKIIESIVPVYNIFMATFMYTFKLCAVFILTKYLANDITPINLRIVLVYIIITHYKFPRFRTLRLAVQRYMIHMYEIWYPMMLIPEEYDPERRIK